MQNIKPQAKIATAGIILIIIIAYFAFARDAVAPAPETSNSQDTMQSTESAVSSAVCDAIFTPAQTEGPYYKSGSPERNNIGQGQEGQKLTVTGYVFDKDCNPIANTWLDFWQADAKGEYDNEGFMLRGHQYTDEQGKYRLETIIPAAYGTRPPHIHVKVRASGPILTSQLYFPNQDLNQRDSIFNKDLVLKIDKSEEQTVAVFNFVLP